MNVSGENEAKKEKEIQKQESQKVGLYIG